MHETFSYGLRRGCPDAFAWHRHAAEYKKMTIRAATANPQQLHVVAIDKFKEIVEKESNGAITVQTFYGARSATNRPTSNSSATPRSISRCWRTNLTPFAPQAGVFILPVHVPEDFRR